MKRTSSIVLCVFLFAGGLYGGYKATASGVMGLDKNSEQASPSRGKSTMWTRESPVKERQGEKKKVSHDDIGNYIKEWKEEKSDGEFIKIFESMFSGMGYRELMRKYPGKGWELKDSLLDEWSRQHPEGILDYFRNHKSELFLTDLDRIFYKCANHDPEKTWDYYIAHKRECYSTSVLVFLVGAYGKKNPEKTWERLLALSPVEQEIAVSEFFEALPPESIKDYIARIDWEKGKDNGNLKHVLLYGLDGKNLTETSEWLVQLPEEWQQEWEKEKGSEKYKDIASLEKALSSLTPREQKEKIMSGIYKIAENEGFLETWNLMEKYVPDMKTAEMDEVSYFLTTWSEQEPEAFEKWHQEQTQEEVRNEADYVYANREPFVKHEDNLALAMQVKDEDKRNRVVRNIMCSWYKEFPEEAVQKMRGLNMKAEEIEQIRESAVYKQYKPELGSLRYRIYN